MAPTSTEKPKTEKDEPVTTTTTVPLVAESATGAPGETVAVAEGTEPETLTLKAAKDAKMAVFYTGLITALPGDASNRTVTEEDWASLGVENQPTLVWNRANGFKVPMSEVKSRKVLDYLNLIDPGFEVRVDDSPEPTESDTD